MNLTSFISSCITLVSDQILIGLLHHRVGGSLLARHAFRIWIFAVRTDKLCVVLIIVIVVFLLDALPALLSNERVTCLLIFLWVILEKGCRGWWLWLIMVARISTNIFTLVEFIVWMQILFKRFANLLILVIHDIGVSNILCMNASPALNHGQGLSMKILIWVRGKTSSDGLLVILVVVPRSS